MATKGSYFLAVLLIANPFMLLFFQNCSSSIIQDRNTAAIPDKQYIYDAPEPEVSYKINKNLITK